MDPKRPRIVTEMADLPVEIMVEIFSYLSPSERRNASMVCKNWLSMLQYQGFRRDYTLEIIDAHFDESLPLVQVLQHSMREFSFIKIGGKISWTREETVQSLLQKLGPSVQELNIANINSDFLSRIQPLQYFTNLRSLKIKDIHYIKDFSSLPPTLRELHVDYLQTIEPRTIVERIRAGKIESLTANVCRLEGGLQELIKIAKVFEGAASTLVTLDPALEELLAELNPEFKHTISINCSNNFLEPAPVSIENITCIKVRRGVRSFHPIRRFPNLIGLDIVLLNSSEVGCFFGHEVIPKPKLTMFRIVNTRKRTCMHCFRTMVDSFPNLERLALQKCEFRDEHLKVINRNLVKLVKLEINGNKFSDHIVYGDRDEYLIGNLKQLKSLMIPDSYMLSDTALFHWQSMPNLTEVAIGQVTPILYSSIENFVTQCPNIQSFKIGPNSDLNDRKLLCMVTGWPNLRKVAIDGMALITTVGLNHIKNHCRRLEVLEFLDDRIGIDEEYDFFAKMTSLNRISNSERTMFREDYLQIEKYVKIHQIPYTALGRLQTMIQEYAISDSD